MPELSVIDGELTGTPAGSEISPAVIAQIVRETPDELKCGAPVNFLEKFHGDGLAS